MKIFKNILSFGSKNGSNVEFANTNGSECKINDIGLGKEDKNFFEDGFKNMPKVIAEDLFVNNEDPKIMKDGENDEEKMTYNNPIIEFVNKDHFNMGFNYGNNYNSGDFLNTVKENMIADVKYKVKQQIEYKRNELFKIENAIETVLSTFGNAEMLILKKQTILDELEELKEYYYDDYNMIFMKAYKSFEMGYKKGLMKFINEELLLNFKNIY